MDFIESIFGIENRWAVLGILVAMHIVLCLVVCKTTKKPIWGWLTLFAGWLFIVIYIWKYPWLFRIVGAVIALGPAELATSLSLAHKDAQPASGSGQRAPAGHSADSGQRAPATPVRDPYRNVGTTANLSPRRGDYLNSLRGTTVFNPLMTEMWTYVSFLCMEILGVEPLTLSRSSDFNDDLGADSLDMAAFIKHISDEVWFPKPMLKEVERWAKQMLDAAEENEQNGSCRFPIRTLANLMDTLLRFIPAHITYPKE
ncbi:MAG: hypothetical protein K6F58_01870 [Bacteroidales bacterium]|nr:hypothetical protein [Bacteroidales bacterium]